jgi:hypothetical protein
MSPSRTWLNVLQYGAGFDMPRSGSGRRAIALVSRYPAPMKLSVLAAFLTLAALPDFAESVRVVDGDTLRVDGVTYRLWGIDAPEAGHLCADGWPAGQTATEHLRALIRNRQVSCEARTLDRYAEQSRFAAPMAETWAPIWWPTAMLGPLSDIAATTSRKNPRLRRSRPAFMVTPAIPCGVARPSDDSYHRATAS